MVRRNPNNKLESWEVAIVKAMLATGEYNDQDILAYFTRPRRSINHARIVEIRNGLKHTRVKPADAETVAAFLKSWPQVDPETGLHLYGDELLIKAREAILLAVQTYNNPKTFFRSEVFIVLAVIAWTYLLHAYYKSKNIDYRYYKKLKGGGLEVLKTKHGADKYWELGACLQSDQCPLDDGAKKNLEFLIGIRHEIEHRMTQSIDDALSAKLQACCINFNVHLRKLFGDEFGLENELSFALQFAGIDPEQKKALMGQDSLPPNVEAMRATFEEALTDEQYRDPQYAYRVLFVPKSVNKKAQADKVIEFVKAGSEEAEDINEVYFRETEKQKYKPAMIVQKMQEEGFPRFSMHSHTLLWQRLDGKDPVKGYGVQLDDGQWYWYENWLDRVREHCHERRDQYS